MKSPSRPASSSSSRDKRRRRRSRPTPKWLQQQQDLDDLARRRCLMVLSVLSGERPVTDVIQEHGISRGLYYQLETKALQAVLRAMAPGGELTGAPGADGMLKRIAELEEQVKQLQGEKRRAERLLFLTRKVVRKGPVSSGLGRPPKRAASSSMRRGAGFSTASPSAAKLSTEPSPPAPSAPTKAGETTP